MFSVKRFVCFLVVFLAGFSCLFAQARGQGRELTVEESFLQESIELMIIREQSRAEGRDMKLVALGFIGDAISRGNRSDEIRETLEFLAMEGVLNVTRENGRVTNNFPDVRRQAAIYLGELGTPEAKNSLLRIVNVDNEPMVISEAIRSLGLIGINENNATTSVINWTVNRFHNLNPDNFLALTALDAFERLAEANGGLRDLETFRTIARIAEGPYIAPVRARAMELLSTLMQFDD